MRVNTLRFQVTPDGPVGMTGDAGLTPDGVAYESPEPEPVNEGPSVEDQLSQLQAAYAEQAQLLEQLAPVAEAWQGMPQQQTDAQAPTMPSPFDENYEQKMTEFLEYRDNQRLGPYQEVMQQQRMEQLEGTARDMIHDVIQTKGELIMPQYEEGKSGLGPEDMILEIAKSYSPGMVAQYGEGVRADEAAIEAAYDEVKGFQDALIAASDARAANQVATLRGAPREPGSSGVAAQPAVTTVAGGWDGFKNKWGLE